jgi:hydroxymethylglutaryl-CoA synthase
MINTKVFSSVYISGIGVYIPPLRLKVGEIAQTWNQDGKKISQSLGIYQKAVAGFDEDSITMAVAAAKAAIDDFKIDKGQIGAVFMGSESHAYAVKPSGGIIGEWLALDSEFFCADLQFACKSATAGLQIVSAMIEAGLIDSGLVIGSDKAQSRPGDALEFTAASGAVAIILSKDKGFAKLNSTFSYTTDTPDFWRRPTQKFPVHAGRFSAEPAYFKHITHATNTFLARIKKDINDFDYVIFHMPNVKFPEKVAKDLGVSTKKLATGLTVKKIGNPYSASSLLGLVRVLAQANPAQSILLTSYGSGSGSDCFDLTKTQTPLIAFQKELELQLNQNINISYVDYLKYMEILSN